MLSLSRKPGYGGEVPRSVWRGLTGREDPTSCRELELRTAEVRECQDELVGDKEQAVWLDKGAPGRVRVGSVCRGRFSYGLT